MRLNNTRQALLLLFLLFLLLSYFSPPSTSSCPQPQFSAGFIPQPTLFLHLSLHFYPSVSPFSPRMHAISRPPVLSCSGLHFHSQGFYLLFCKPVPFKVHVLFYCFYFALRCCIICCQVRLPVFVNTHMQGFI